MKRARAASNPSIDPVISLTMRYTLPVELVGIVALLAFLVCDVNI